MAAPDQTWLGPFSVCIPAGIAGLSVLKRVPTQVMPRTGGRRNAERERYCLAATVRWLLLNRPSLFPATLGRQAMKQSPDFVLEPASGSRAVAIEQIDAGHRSYHRWMDRLEREGGVWPPASSVRAWFGERPKKRFVKQVAIAVCRKRNPTTWRDAPPGSIRATVIFDNTSTAGSVADEEVPDLLASALRLARWPSEPDETIFFVRSMDRIFVTGRLAGPHGAYC
jgi:hypothetical protein